MPFRRLQRVLLGISLCLTPQLGADSLEAYLREAFAAHPELEARYQRYQAALRVGAREGALPDPKLSFTEFVQQVQTRTGPQERALVLSQSMPWPGKLRLRRGVADAEAEGKFFEYEAQRRELLEAVSLAYFDYAYLGRAVAVARENRELLRQLQPVVADRVRGGGNLASSLRLDVELARSEDTLRSLERQRPALSSRLEAVLGRTPSSRLLPWPELPERLPRIASPEELRRQVKAHPLVAGTESEVAASRQGLELARKSGRPDLTLGTNVIDIGAGADTAVGIMVGMSLPVWRGKYRAEREEAASRVRAAQADARDVRHELLVRFDDAWQRYTDAARRVALYDEGLLPPARQAVELTEESYRNDRASLTDLIDTERTLLDLQLVRFRALADAHKAAVQVRALTEPVAEDALP